MTSTERVKKICQERKIPISRLEKECYFANGYIGQLKKDLPLDRAQKISDYLNVSLEFLLAGKETSEDKETATKQKEVKEIREILEKTKKQLQQEGVLFDGKLASSSTVNAVLSGMEMGAAMAEKKSKEQENANIRKFVAKEPILNAAHLRTDIVIPDDIDTSDDDIMDDENF